MATLEQLQDGLIKADAAGNADDARAFANEIRKMRSVPTVEAPQPSMMDSIKQGAGNLVAGAVRGAGSIGSTLMAAGELLPSRMIPRVAAGGNILPDMKADAERRAGMDAGLQSMGAEPDSWMYKGGKLAGEIAGTAGTGNALALGARGLGASPTVVNALRSGGMSVGGATGGGALAARIAGGSATGAASTALINPEDAGMGAIVGGVLPAVAVGVGRGAQAVGNAYRNFTPSKEMQAATKFARAVGLTREELRQAVSIQAPSMIQGYQQTVPQILQNPTASQIQRNLKTAGNDAIGGAERLQQSQYRAAMENIAAIDLSVQDAASRAGGAIQDYAKPAFQKAGERVNNLFESVDPFGQTKFQIPVAEMTAAKNKYLGAGSFGSGASAEKALKVANEISTEALPAVKATASAKPSENLEQFIRKQGGMRSDSGLTGESRALSNKQTGTTGLINNKSGKSSQELAESAYERGFISEPDSGMLMEALQGRGGRNLTANDSLNMEQSWQAMAERAMGDAPEAAKITKNVSFNELQNMRSSLGEAWGEASAKGRNKEAAALKQMILEIDGRVKTVAAGKGNPDEYFAPDMVKTWREAIDAHSAKQLQFKTGPQSAMFRQGADGQASIQGAEIPAKFYSGNRSQVEDAKAFKKLIGNRTDLADEMKRYAMTEGANTSNQAGDLTSKFTKWMKSRSGANRELFSEQENATLREVGKAVEKSLRAENLERVTGSDTAQKIKTMESMGLMDNKFINGLVSKTPIVGRYLDAGLMSLRNTAAQSQTNELAKLLANPQAMQNALTKKKITPQEANMLTKILTQGASRTAPALIAQ